MIKTVSSKTEDIDFANTADGLMATGSQTTIKIIITEKHRANKNIQKEMIQFLIESLIETIK
jgi:hypothetical protein